ncbi:MAG: DedA family protein [Bacteroidales bacterium]|nr:DedA family protein [Bacteroidales bacterium]
MHFYDSIVQWYMDNMNYFSITILMMIESTVVPLPSEVVIPPAVYKALNTGEMSVPLIVFFGTLGALLGASINYFVAKYVGRILVYRFADSRLGHLFLVNQEKVVKAEQYFIKNGNSSTFVGRLVPGIRHLISIPAGLAKMNLGKFVFYTTLGAGSWNICLAAMGYLAYNQKGAIDKYAHEFSIGLLILGVAFISYLIFNAVKKNKK